jgi:hypothetical protein
MNATFCIENRKDADENYCNSKFSPVPLMQTCLPKQSLTTRVCSFYSKTKKCKFAKGGIILNINQASAHSHLLSINRAQLPIDHSYIFPLRKMIPKILVIVAFILMTVPQSHERNYIFIRTKHSVIVGST